MGGSSEEHGNKYGTFGAPPPVGFPQPTPPPGVVASAPPLHPNVVYYPHGYQSVPTTYVAEGTPIIVGRPRLPCCGIGLGWFLFIIGFFLASIPWYVGAVLLLCSRVDYREKPGYIACTIAALIAVIAIILGLSSHDDW